MNTDGTARDEVTNRQSTAMSLLDDLVELAHVRTEAELADREEHLRDRIGRALLPNCDTEARSRFEHDVGAEYPKSAVGHVDVPFEQLLAWLVRA